MAATKRGVAILGIFVADLAFDWASVRGWDAQALLVNPLGFRVNAYRVTPELPS